MCARAHARVLQLYPATSLHLVISPYRFVSVCMYFKFSVHKIGLSENTESFSSVFNLDAFYFSSCLIVLARTANTMLNRSEIGHLVLLLISEERPSVFYLSIMLAVVFFVNAFYYVGHFSLSSL